MSLHYLVKYECQKWHQSEIGIVINDTLHASVAKHIRCDELHYYTFIIQSTGERIFKIDEHLAKLQVKWLIVSCAPFALHFFRQRCWSRQINWITCVLRIALCIRTETVLVVVMLIGRLMWVYYQQIPNCCRPDLTYWQDRLMPSVTGRLLIMYGILLQELFLLWQLCTVGHEIFIWPM